MTVLTATGGTPNPLVLTYTDSSGTARAVDVNYTTQTVKTNFGCSGITEYGPTSASLVSSITYPDGNSLSFTYEPTPGFGGDVTGRIQSITLRTGATITYTYTGANNGIECADGSMAGFTRATSDGTTAYSRSGSGTAWTTTVTDASLAGNQTVINFQSAIPTGGSVANFYETHRSTYQGSASATPPTVLRQSDTCYNFSAVPCTAIGITLPITLIRTYSTLDNNQQSLTGVNFNNFGLPIQVDELDFGNGTPNGLIRSTATAYASLGNNIVNRPASVIVTDNVGSQKSKTTFGYDEATPAATSGVPQHTAITGSRGNVTSINRWLNTTNSNLTTALTYDDTGNVLTSTDPGGHQTQFSYTDNFSDGLNRSSLAYVTQVTAPDTHSPGLAHHVTHVQYEPNTGLPSTSTDQNGNQTTFTYDSLLRPLLTNFPDGGQTTVSYPSTTQTVVQNKLDSSHSTYSTTLLDSYGRVSRTAMANGEATPYDVVDTCYDSNGRTKFQSYPYQAASYTGATVCSGAGDSFAYDGGGRITQLTHSDGSNVQYSYNGRAQQVQDEGNGTSNVKRIFQSNAAGQLTGVCEVSAATLLGSGGTPASCGLDLAGTGFLTSYAYDTLGNLTTVTQGSLVNRTFAYNSLSRLTSESEPEWTATTGTPATMSYSYNSDSLLTQRTRPKVNQAVSTVTTTTTYVYDELHRLTQRTYSDTTAPNAYFNFDETAPLGIGVLNSVGRITSEYNNAGPESIFSYDTMGRVTNNWQCPFATGCSSSANYRVLGYTYDLAGNMVSSGNGTGLIWNFGYNTAPRLTSVTQQWDSASLLSSVHYNAFGQDTSSALGTVTSSTGINENRTYNTRGQLQSRTSAVNGGSSLDAFSGVTYAPNGNMTAVNDSINYGNWIYSYDDFNRLKSSAYQALGPTVNTTYDYDRYGNRWNQNGTNNWSQSFDTNNHMIGWSYDALGNLLNDGSHSYTYDAEGRLLTVDGGAPTGTTYTYDAEQRRVARTTGTGTRATHSFLYDLAGHDVMEYDPSFIDRDEVYAGARHLTTYYAGQTFFSLVDWLGNERVRSTQDGSSLQSFQNLPFGDGQLFGGSATGNAGPLGFTGDEHDSESNLEHTWFRQYASAEGRWTTPDLYPGSMDVGNPQSFNRYAYVMNAPLTLIDPLGLDPMFFWYGGCLFTYESTSHKTKENVVVVEAGPISLVGCAAGNGGTGNSGTGNGGNLSGCRQPNVVQKAGVKAQTWIAKLKGGPVGIGLGGSAGAGHIFGAMGGVSAQMWVFPNGQAALVYSWGSNTIPMSPTPVGITEGVGFVAGLQVSFSSAKDVPGLQGKSVDIGAGAGDGWGAGIDISVAQDLSSFQKTYTIGGGLGGYGGGVVFQDNVVVPVCSN